MSGGLTRPGLWLSTLALLLGASGCVEADERDAGWTAALQAQIERIDRETPGSLGVYVKRLSDGERLSYGGERFWYLGSTTKVPIAIAVLQEVESGRLALDRSLVLQAGDRIDGAGDVVWQQPGRRYTVQDLLRRMLMDSDNTAANLLVRTIGTDTLNRRARSLLGARHVRELTDFSRVRREVYAGLHPSAGDLSNLQLVQVAAEPLGPGRVEAVRRVLSLRADELQQRSIEAAYGGYYARGLNSATLEGYGTMLEQLVRGRLLSPAHTQLLFEDMKFGSYDAYRLEAGLPRTVRFIHKTGTQLARACHMGVIEPQDGGRQGIVVAVCAADLDESKQAGAAFQRIGEAITRTMLARPVAAPAAR